MASSSHHKASPHSWAERFKSQPALTASLAFSGVLLALFYLILPFYGPDANYSVFGWMANAWNSETNYEHGYLVPVMILVMLLSVRKQLKESLSSPDWKGLIAIGFGLLLFLAAYRTGQARVAVASFPFVVCGSVWYLWGWRTMCLVLYPVFFIGLAVPLPSFQQNTVPLQLMATEGAHWLSGLFGTETIVDGTEIRPANGDWMPLQVAGGCSGIRSLMALIMISATWAFLAHDLSFWKRGILLFAALPLAVVGNVLRIGSICILADRVGYEFAAGTWHDWSGLLLFYPISLALLFVTHSILKGHIPFVERRQVVVTQSTATAS